MKHLNIRKYRKGTTMLEVLVASSILTLIMLIGINTWMTSLTSVNIGIQNSAAESDVSLGMRYITQQLREAMTVTVSTDGRTLTYYLPVTNPDGTYANPLTRSSIQRQFYVATVSGSTLGLYERVGTGTPRLLVNNVRLTDVAANRETTAIRPFEATGVGITRMVTIFIVVRRTTTEDVTDVRLREQVYMRNIPAITR